MQPNITHTSCPLCNHSHIHKVLSVKDYSVSSENFEIWECKKCSFRFTQHIPSLQNISPYYQSSTYISHSDTKKGFINRLYHIARNFTIKSKKHLVEKYSHRRKGNLLDVGAGTGAFVEAMQNEGWHTTGLEPDENARKNALTIHHVQLIPIEEISSLTENGFDAITLWHVLEHVHDLHEYMEIGRAHV